MTIIRRFNDRTVSCVPITFNRLHRLDIVPSISNLPALLRTINYKKIHIYRLLISLKNDLVRLIQLPDLLD